MTLNYFAQQIVSPTGLPQVQATPATLDHILTILFTVLGSIALLMLVISGFRYVTSQGEPQKVAEVRRQILYITIGLILAASADAIVTFVLGRAG